MVAIGNLLNVVFARVYTILGPRNFFLLNSGLILVFSGLYFWIRRVYVYREDRPTVVQRVQVDAKLKQ